jgi:hypothetical protein
MAVLHQCYIFDYEQFSANLKDLSTDMGNKQFDSLKRLAYQLAKSNNDIWKILELFRYYPDDIEHEDDEFDREEDYVRFWLFIVLFSCCKLIENPQKLASKFSKFGKVTGLGDLFTRIKGEPIDTLINLVDGENLKFHQLLPKLGLINWLDRHEINDLSLKIKTVLNLSDTLNPELRDTFADFEHILVQVKSANQGLLYAIAD